MPPGSESFAAQAYIIVDAKSGHVLQQSEPRDKRQVGSLTKVADRDGGARLGRASAAAISARSRPIPPEAFAGDGENLIGFQPGDTAELRDLLYAALVQSDNIAAYTLAQSCRAGAAGRGAREPAAAPVATFVGQMNALADDAEDGAHALRQPARHGRKREAGAVLDRGRYGAADALRDEQRRLPFLRLAKGAPDLVHPRRRTAETTCCATRTSCSAPTASKA